MIVNEDTLNKKKRINKVFKDENNICGLYLLEQHVEVV